MDEKKIRVAITHGNTNGIGYELILKTFEDPMMLELCTPIIYGSPKVASYHKKALGSEVNFSIIGSAEEAKDGKLNLLTCFDEEIKVEIGQPSQEAESAALRALERALQDQQQGLVDVIVTAPAEANNNIVKSVKAFHVRICDELRIALVTTAVAIRDVADAITKPIIVEKATMLHQMLRRDLRISSPRIAIMALNPVANGEQLGTEEQETIVPAIEELEQQGIQAFGPYPADEFFGSGAYTKFDVVLAMYHDQGMAPLKSLATEPGVVLTVGLPFVCTSPACGVGFGQAGKGTADEAPMRNAVYAAIDCCRNRRNYDEPLENPLPKLYREKRDDSEKVRFSIPKAKGATPAPSGE